ncbi:MAG: peptidoglycan DD-metalloendopeptidase family protein [Patescibacteria group bacterium]
MVATVSIFISEMLALAPNLHLIPTTISIRIKTILISSLIAALRLIMNLGRGLQTMLLYIGRPFKHIIIFFFKHGAVHLYRLYFVAKKWLTSIFAPAKNKVIYPLLHKSTIHVVLVLVGIAVIANNIIVKETKAEEFAQTTILASLVTDYQDFDIVETALTETPRATSYFRDSGVLTLFDATTKESIVGGEGTDGIMTSESSAALVRPGLAQTTLGNRPREEVVYYTVEGGDTVSTIAEKFNISSDTILWENKLGVRDVIKPGQTLTILPQSGVSHQVKSGDTVDTIAKKYKVDANDILEYNKLADASAIEADQVLLIPGGTIDPPPPAVRSYAAAPYSGSVPASAAISGGSLQWPTTSHKISQYYKWGHLAIDIAGDYTSPVYAADAGRVEAVGWGSGYGNRIIINHGNGIKTLYAHHSKMFVSVGDSVSRGQTIGMIGCTGWCTGPHVHFEVYVNGAKVNPLTYL